MKVRDLVGQLKEKGWTEVSCNGSHHKMALAGNQYHIIVPYRNAGEEINRRTLGLIRRQMKLAGIPIRL